MIFKAIDDVPGTMSDIWENQATFEESSLEALNVDNKFKQHYKNRIVQKWETFNPTQVNKTNLFTVHYSFVCLIRLIMTFML